MIRVFRLLAPLLSRNDKLALTGILILSLLTAAIEVIGVGGIFWFFNLVIDPQAFERHAMLSWLKVQLQIQDSTDFLTIVGLLVLGIFLFRIFASITLVWAQDAFAQSRLHIFTERLMRRYLAKPYEEFIGVHTASLNKNLVSEVPRLINGVMVPAVQLVSASIISAAIGLALIWYDPLTSSVVMAIIGGVYALLYLVTQGPERRLGVLRSETDEGRFKIATEAMTGFKEVKVFGSEAEYVARFAEVSKRFVRYELIHKLLSQVPHFVLEGVAFAVLMTLMLVSLHHTVDRAEVVAEVSLYAFAAYRLMPSVRNVAASLAELRFNEEALHIIGWEVVPSSQGGLQHQAVAQEPIPFSDRITFQGVSFTFPDRALPAIDKIDLVIRRNSSVAFVGATGAGKSTLVDMLMGLIEPQEGRILIDDLPLNRTRRASWCSRMGYVPQHIFLADDTVARNIAFGQPDQEIDVARVKKAARLACIDSFIEIELPDRYQTRIGERGLRLSGGQRQRLGIARALYREPDLLVLDEATSALDAETEADITEALGALAGKVTIIVIAHRLATVRGCDVVHLLERGRIQASGTLEELMQTHVGFRRLADLNRIGT